MTPLTKPLTRGALLLRRDLVGTWHGTGGLNGSRKLQPDLKRVEFRWKLAGRLYVAGCLRSGTDSAAFSFYAMMSEDGATGNRTAALKSCETGNVKAHE
jgi:hypothetical protein